MAVSPNTQTPPAAADSERGKWHAVKKGENLEDIANEAGVESEEIWNHDYNADLRGRVGTRDRITAGDRLFVPAPQKPPDETPATAGQGDHVVKDGECISSIAKNTGHFWETIWNDGGNSGLREVRQDPNVLLPGDRVTVPPIRPKQDSGQTEMRHRFVRKGEPSKLKLVIKAGGKPRANQPYVLEVDGQTITGTTDPEGGLEVRIPGNAKSGRLTVGEGDAAKNYPLNLGKLDPPTTLSGMQARLNNLGFACGNAEGKWDDETKEAILAFQEKNGLERTGKADDATRQKVKEVHGY
jgi:N-acetylmuramoyl-L-alanine amidase